MSLETSTAGTAPEMENRSWNGRATTMTRWTRRQDEAGHGQGRAVRGECQVEDWQAYSILGRFAAALDPDFLEEILRGDAILKKR
jgi:hypothetical protein